MEEPVKHMLAALQRQRNSANDRIVDLEVGIAMKDAQISAIQEDLANANETVNILREKYQQVLAVAEQQKGYLDSLIEQEKPFLLRSNGDEYVVESADFDNLEVLTHEDGEVSDKVEESLDKKEESFVEETKEVVSTFEDFVDTTTHKHEKHGNKFFGKHKK